MTNEVLSYSDIYEKLFGESIGACCVLDVMDLTNADSIVQQLKIIKDVWSNSENIRHDKEMVKIYENFILWGCKFSSKLIVLNLYIDVVDIIMDFMTLMYDHLPVASINNSMFDNQTLMKLYDRLKDNCHEAPKIYIRIFTKLWLFCEKEIVNENIICTIMMVLCELLRNNKLNDLIGDLFEYSGIILKLYVDRLGHKINNILVVNKCITLVQVVVRTEKHAVGRLFFWWQLICSTRKEIVRKMIDICLIPFLANLFGKHITFNKEENFNYSACQYNSFTNYDDLSPLCHFVMSHILQTITGEIPIGLTKPKTKLTYLGNLDKDLFADIHIVEPFLERFLAAFYFWCQFGEKTNKSQPFHLLDVVFKSLAVRFSVTGDGVSSKTMLKEMPETVEPSLFKIVNICMKIKTLLEDDLSHLNRTTNVVFTDHSTIITSMVTSLSHFRNGKTFTTNGLITLKNLLSDNLLIMQNLMTVSKKIRRSINQETSGQWLTNSQSLVDMIFSSDVQIDSGNLSGFIGGIVTNWFTSFLGENIPESRLDHGIWMDNIKLWCFVALKIYSEFEKDDLSLNYVKEYQELKPFIDYLRAPVLFIKELDHELVNSNDFDLICLIHENLYHTFAQKATLIPSLNSNEWCGQLCKLLGKQLLRFDNKMSNKQTLLLNFTIRFIRLIVFYCDPMETINDIDQNYKKNTLWGCISALITCYTKLDVSNIRLTLKDQNDSIFTQDLLATSKKMEKISKHLQISSDFDNDFTLGMALYTTERVIHKLGHNPQMVFEATSILSPMIAHIIDLDVAKKKMVSTRVRQKIMSTKNVKDSLMVEQSVIAILKQIKTICSNLDIFPALSPIFATVFSYTAGMISQQTMTFMVQYWNIEIMKNEDKITFTKEFLLILKNAKRFYPNLNVPGQLERTVSIIAEVVKNMPEDPSKKRTIGSFLNKINNEEITKKNETAVFIRPKKNLPKKIQTYSLSRQSSDADYTIVESPPVKRRRLTEHQKEVFTKQRNNFIPGMFVAFENNEIPKLMSQDSDLSNLETDKCNIDDDSSVASTVIEECHEDVKEIENVSEMLSNTNGVIVFDGTLIVPDEITKVSEEISVACLPSTEMSNDVVFEQKEKNVTPLKENEMPILDNKTGIVENDVSKTLTKEMVLTKPLNVNEEIKRKPLLDRNPCLNSVCSPSVTGRTQRIVQMALQNHLKRKDGVPRNSPNLVNNEDRNHRSGIMRHTWSESKKDAKVSFSVPLVHSKLEESLTDKEGEEFTQDVYLSPVFNRSQSFKTVSPIICDLVMDENDSFSQDFPVTVQSPRMFSVMCSDSRSAEKVRLSLETEEDLSPIMKTTEEIVQEVYLSPTFDRSESPKKLSDFEINEEDSFSQDYPMTVQSPRMFSVTCSNSRSAERVRQSFETLEDLSPIKKKDNELIVQEVCLSPVFDRSEPPKKLIDIEMNEEDSFSQDYPKTVQSPRMSSVTFSNSRSAERVRQSFETVEDLSPIMMTANGIVQEVYLSPTFERSEPPKKLTDSEINEEDSFSQDYPMTVQSPRMFSVTCSNSRSAERVRQSFETLEDLSPIKNMNDRDEDVIVAQEVYLSPIFDRSQSTKNMSHTSYDIDMNDENLFSQDCPVTVQSPGMFSVTCSDSRSAMKVRQSLATLEHLSPIKKMSESQIMSEEKEREPLLSALDTKLSRQVDVDSDHDEVILQDAIKVVRAALGKSSPNKISQILDALFKKQ